MPFADFQGARHYYRHEGADGLPVLMLSHSLGVDHGMWDPQLPQWLPHLALLRYDTRGHGASDATPGDYTIEQLGRDALAIADAAGVERFAFCGLSLGGMIGQWLAANAPDRLTHLILANTSARLTDPDGMEARRRAVLDRGMPAVVDMVMGRFFSKATLASNVPVAAWARRALLATSPAAYAGCCAAIRDMDLTPLIGRIEVPTLVIGDNQDVSLPWDPHGARLADSIRGARALKIPAAHLSNLERPRTFGTAVLEFVLPHGDRTAAAGMRIRRAVLGDAHVDRSLTQATPFTRDFQELITDFAWGAVWARAGLERRTRRLLVLAIVAALGRWEEFRLHVRTGLSGELEACDLKEVLLHVAVYAGVPAANTAFQIAAEEVSSWLPDSSPLTPHS
jgi:3-oxoadipate enol-lactonase/4-carboxymuconolactone decarboxylase